MHLGGKNAGAIEVCVGRAVLLAEGQKVLALCLGFGAGETIVQG